jgi:hypothetical protein
MKLLEQALLELERDSCEQKTDEKGAPTPSPPTKPDQK